MASSSPPSESDRAVTRQRLGIDPPGPQAPPWTTREWFNSAKNYALYANDAGLYDEILKYVK